MKEFVILECLYPGSDLRVQLGPGLRSAIGRIRRGGHSRATAILMLLTVSTVFARDRVFDPPKKMIVIAPVADVRAEPKRGRMNYDYDALQETQVSKGEPVLVFEERGAWARVECPQQQEFTHKKEWQGYPGWIEKKYLTDDLGREVLLTTSAASSDALRQEILDYAAQHIGERYFWGGRSLHNERNKAVRTGVDCSGLVNWSYRQIGWTLPRDAHELSMKARSLTSLEQLKPADLIFLAKPENPQKIHHVMIYKGDGIAIEAPQTGERVREIALSDRLKSDTIVIYGTYFPEEK